MTALDSTKHPRRTRTRFPGVYCSVSGGFEILYRDSDGRLRSEAVKGGLEAAKAARAERVSKLHRGERVAPTRLRFSEWAEEWIAGLDKRPRTIEAHRYALDKHLLPRFRNRKLSAINPDHVARLVADMRKAGYSGWTIHGALSTLGGCLGRAKRRGLIPSNPVRELERDERPSVGDGEKLALSEAQIAAVLDNATGGFRPMIATMIFGGLRLGETLALRWDSIDYDGGFIRVRQQLTRNRELDELKTGAARRDVVLIPQLAQTLKEHYMASLRKRPDDFVFSAPEGRGRDHRSTSRAIERTVKRAGLDGQGISAHNFRHSFASLLIVGLKLDPVSVATQLGHTTPATTLHFYAHLYEQAKHADEARDKLAEGFGHLLSASS